MFLRLRNFLKLNEDLAVANAKVGQSRAEVEFLRKEIARERARSDALLKKLLYMKREGYSPDLAGEDDRWPEGRYSISQVERASLERPLTEVRPSRPMTEEEEDLALFEREVAEALSGRS